MEEKINQLVIEKVENGFIISLQNKETQGILSRGMIDKKFYVANNEQDAIKIVNLSLFSLESNYQTEKRLKYEEEKDDEDRH